MDVDLPKLVQYTKSLKVLYVEDNEFTRASTVTMLMEFFESVIEAVDGLDAIEKLEQQKCDLIITDINMPNMTGIELAKKTKQTYKELPVLVFSAHDEPNYFIESIQIGIDGYLLKPIHLNQFLTTLDKVVTHLRNQEAEKKFLELQKTNEKNEALKNMLFNITHHWRQPLNAITTNAGVIQVHNQNSEQRNENYCRKLDNINQNALILSKMLDDFQSIFKYDNSIKKSCIDLDVILKDILKPYENDITIVMNMKKTVICIQNTILYDVIYPIIQNSIEAMSDKEIKYLEVSACEKEDIIELVIKDTGGGIDPKNLDQVFEPYFTTHHQYFGKGLGLFFVYNIMKNYINGKLALTNYSLEYEGKKYNGACVTMQFPKEF